MSVLRKEAATASVGGEPTLSAVSLFSNCGAGDVGFRTAGFNFAVLAELQARRLEVASWNHPGARLILGDLRDTWRDVVTAYQTVRDEKPLDLLAACPPCQGMSSAQGRRGLGDDADAGSRDPRNLLVMPIARVALALRPHAIVVENVPAFLTRLVRHPDMGVPISAARLLIALLEDEYEVFPLVTDLCDYGIPQTRRRAFLTFLRKGAGALNVLRASGLAPYPIPLYAEEYGGTPVSLGVALKEMGLPSLDAVSEASARPPGAPELHFVPIWKDRRYQMVNAIEAGSGRSAWDNDICEGCGPVSVARCRANCPKCRGPLLRPVVKSRNGRYRLIRGFAGSSYRRMRPDIPASTITTASGHIGSDFTIHPWDNRLLSPLECALLQGFPRDFNWGNSLERWGHTAVRAMIGEAVPPQFTRLHGEALARLLKSSEAEGLLSAADSRHLRGLEKLRKEAAS